MVSSSPSPGRTGRRARPARLPTSGWFRRNQVLTPTPDQRGVQLPPAEHIAEACVPRIDADPRDGRRIARGLGLTPSDLAPLVGTEAARAEPVRALARAARRACRGEEWRAFLVAHA